MTAVGDESSSLASKCLDLCQTLASQGQAFTFSLTIGSTFNFSVSTGSQDSPVPPAPKVENRKSPSARRRNARRRKEFLKRKSGLPSSTSLKPAKDSTDVTLASLDAMVPSSANVMNVEVDEELFSSPLEEDEDHSDSDDSMEEDDNEDLPSRPFCIVCKAHSYPPHRVRAVSDLMLGMISQGKGDPVGLIKSILYCDKHTVTSNSAPVCDLLM